MSKKILTLMTALILVLSMSGLSFGIANINVTGTGNTPNIVQVGPTYLDNDAFITGSGGGFSNALTHQMWTGTGNTARIEISAWFSDAKIFQWNGTDNTARQSQTYGVAHGALIEQHGGEGNEAKQEQSSGSIFFGLIPLPGHNAEIYQYGGSDNEAGQFQNGGSLNNALIVQKRGEGNTARQEQGGTIGTVEIFQYGGLYNTAKQFQTKGSLNSALIEQHGGEGNEAKQEQSSSLFGSGHEAEIFQYGGTRNTARQTQSGKYGNYAYIIQPYGRGQSRDNTARQIQDGKRNTARTRQLGFENTARIEQVGNDNGHAITDPGGSGKWTSLVGYLPSRDWSQIQDGRENEAYTYVEGNGNQTVQHQDDGNLPKPGSWNYAKIDILGDCNQAFQVQSGNRNESRIKITGDGNRAATYQDGGHNASITLVGPGNVATIIGSGTWPP